MVVLKDDKHVFPPYQGAPMFKEKFKSNIQKLKPLNKLEGKISDEEMQEMNYKVTVKMKDPYNVAKHYLEKKV